MKCMYVTFLWQEHVMFYQQQMEEFQTWMAQKFHVIVHILWAQELPFIVMRGTRDMDFIPLVIVFNLEFGCSHLLNAYQMWMVSKT